MTAVVVLDGSSGCSDGVALGAADGVTPAVACGVDDTSGSPPTDSDTIITIASTTSTAMAMSAILSLLFITHTSLDRM